MVLQLDRRLILNQWDFAAHWMAGKLGGQFETGRHLAYPQDTPMSNLLLTILTKAGVQIEKIGDSNQPARSLALKYRNRIHRRAGPVRDGQWSHGQHKIPAVTRCCRLAQRLQIRAIQDVDSENFQYEIVHRVAEKIARRLRLITCCFPYHQANIALL